MSLTKNKLKMQLEVIQRRILNVGVVDMIKVDTGKESLADFGKTLTIVLFLLSSFWSYKGSQAVSGYFLYAAFFFSFFSLLFPRSLKYLYIYWIKLANMISQVVTKIILFIVYYSFLTPYSLLVKLFKGRLLDTEINPEQESYWVTRKKVPINLDRYKRQF